MASFKLNENTISFVEGIESLLGILDNKLLRKVEKEYNRNRSVYNLKHHRDDALLKLQTARLVKDCQCKTPENKIRFYDELKKIIGGPDCLGITQYISNIPKERYPVLPEEHIKTILEAYDSIKPYYTNAKDITRLDMWYQLVLNFYSNWESILNIKSDILAQEHWLNEMLILAEIEEDAQARNTILNVLQRKYPSLERYLESFK